MTNPMPRRNPHIPRSPTRSDRKGVRGSLEDSSSPQPDCTKNAEEPISVPALTHAYEFGRRLARRLPGHAIEHFLAEQARGLHDGLEAEHAAEALLDAAVTRHHERAGQVTTLTVTVRPKEGAATDEEARPTPAAGVRTPSQTD